MGLKRFSTPSTVLSAGQPSGFGIFNFKPLALRAIFVQRQPHSPHEESCIMATIAEPVLSFTRLPHPAPWPMRYAKDFGRARFCTQFTDHMVVIEWTEGKGWHDATLGPRPHPARPGGQRSALCAGNL
jgi:hypothetical protein